ncbi:MAG: hypothetical protein IJP66_06315, partial [Kiritimatiellae bacterium]|nr:hypothetical protein [Kiritimatiellia bacterium]
PPVGDTGRDILADATSAPDGQNDDAVVKEDGDALGMAKEASRIAREEARLADAADLMEEAFSHSPSLRAKYASRVKLWRAGVSM